MPLDAQGAAVPGGEDYRNPADLDAAARPGWPRSSPSSIRVDGNGHPLELRGTFYVATTCSVLILCACVVAGVHLRRSQNLEDQLADNRLSRKPYFRNEE